MVALGSRVTVLVFMVSLFLGLGFWLVVTRYPPRRKMRIRGARPMYCIDLVLQLYSCTSYHFSDMKRLGLRRREDERAMFLTYG